MRDDWADEAENAQNIVQSLSDVTTYGGVLIAAAAAAGSAAVFSNPVSAAVGLGVAIAGLGISETNKAIVRSMKEKGEASKCKGCTKRYHENSQNGQITKNN